MVSRGVPDRSLPTSREKVSDFRFLGHKLCRGPVNRTHISKNFQRFLDVVQVKMVPVLS